MDTKPSAKKPPLAAEPVATREPPGWVPTAALLSVPATLTLVGVGSARNPALAITALVVGVFFSVLLIGWWATPPREDVFNRLVVVALFISIVMAGAIIGLTALADRTPGLGPPTDTDSSNTALAGTAGSSVVASNP